MKKVSLYTVGTCGTHKYIHLLKGIASHNATHHNNPNVRHKHIASGKFEFHLLPERGNASETRLIKLPYFRYQARLALDRGSSLSACRDSPYSQNQSRGFELGQVESSFVAESTVNRNVLSENRKLSTKKDKCLRV